MPSMTASASTPISRTTRLRRWGLYLLGSSLLFLLQEWINLPDWLWTGLFFAISLLAYDWLWPGASFKGKSVWRWLGEFLIVLLLLMIAGELLAWVGITLGLRFNFLLAAILAALGLILLAAGAIFGKW